MREWLLQSVGRSGGAGLADLPLLIWPALTGTKEPEISTVERY